MSLDFHTISKPKIVIFMTGFSSYATELIRKLLFAFNDELDSTYFICHCA